MLAKLANPSVARIPGLASWVACLGIPQFGGPELDRTEISVCRSVGRIPKTLRLICDSAESAPPFASDSSCGVIFDGFLFDRDALIDQFDLSPKASDAEIILRAYRLLGEEVVQKLTGIYVLIIWNSGEDLLFCCRDKVGNFPLFYADTKHEFLISSCLQSLTLYPAVSKAVNRLVICEYLSNRWPNPDETFFEQIKRVPAAHILHLQNGNRRLSCYWDPLPDSSRGEWRDGELNQFDQLFEKSIERCMSVGRSAIFLSGGLDSVSVASVAADIAARKEFSPLLALSLLYPHPECNEEETQRSVAAQLNIPQVLLHFETVYGSKGLLSKAVELSRSWPVPTLAPWKSGFLHLAHQARERECSVILNGSGGDEWLTVNPLHSADLIKFLNLPALVVLLRNLLRSYSLPPLALMRYILWNCGLKQLIRAYAPAVVPDTMRSRRIAGLRRSTPSWIAVDPELRKAVEQRLEEIAERSIQKPVPKGKYTFYFDNFRDIYQRSLASMEIEEHFETGRRSGTLFLRPFFDPELIQLLLRIRPSVLHQGGREKGLVRTAVAHRFPNLRFESQKKIIALGFLKSILLNEGPPLWQQMKGTQALIHLGIVDKTSLPTVFDDSLAGNIDENYRIWKLLSVEAWVGSRV